MSTAEPRNAVQFSLTTLLVFVVAVGLWFLIATRADIPSQRYLSGGIVAIGLFLGVMAYRRKERARALMLGLFVVVVLGSHIALRYSQLLLQESRERRLVLLERYQREVVRHNVDPGSWPKSGHLLDSAAALYQAIKNTGASVGQFPTATVNGVTEFRGAEGGRLVWAKNRHGEYVLIDLGPDNAMGGTLAADGTYIRRAVDANEDGVDDGVDDVVQDVMFLFAE